jgi:hypothetical protein
MTTTATRTNKFGAKCATCGQWVAEGAGILSGSKGAWKTTHAGECPAPRPTGAPAAQPALGYYVRADGAGIKVVESKRNPGRVYGLVFTPPAYAGKRPTWEFVRGAGYSVADLAPMDAADAAQIGLSAGHCIECCAPLGGKTLSAQAAAIVGYGEVCASNNGWPFPKGVAAQRAVIEAKCFDQYREPTRREALGR